MALPDRIPGWTIEGLAIVSADHMIADASGVQPDALKPEADQRFFHGSLDKADAVVHGRHSSEGGPQAANRRRLILTRRVPTLARDPGNTNAVLWNPAGATLAEALEATGRSGGLLCVIGGTQAFGLFLDLGYDAFHLSRMSNVRLPGGRPVFPNIPPDTPENLLAGRGLNPEPMRVLDASDGLLLVTWRR